MKDASCDNGSPAPLLTAVYAESQVHLIVGGNPLAAARCAKSLEAGAKPVIIAPDTGDLHFSLSEHIENGSVQWVRREFQDDDLKTLGREEVDHVVDTVFITLGGNHPLSAHISKLCRRLRIPVNVSDAPELCTFSLLSTYSDGPLHIGITTSGRGCKLASRLRREISSSLPSNLGAAIDRLGAVRRRLWAEDHAAGLCTASLEGDEDDFTGQSHTFNKLVTEDDVSAAKTRRIRWLSQICEYWPLQKLAAISDADIDAILQAYSSGKNNLDSTNGVGHLQKKGKIVLAGSGPGHPDMLTRATYNAIQNADIILADKLVPEPVLKLIPRRTEVHIARKFPGNADQAQEEFLQMGLDSLRRGRYVLRLKQGDPYLYGRGGEEFEFFRGEGYTPIVLPGITSALSASLFAEIPATHRGVSDQVLICTGTGRKGAAPEPPTYVPTQTVVFLMALHRLSALVESLTTLPQEEPTPSGHYCIMSSKPQTYLSNGQVLGSPPLWVRINRFIENIYLFLGLYFVSLFSVRHGLYSSATKISHHFPRCPAALLTRTRLRRTRDSISTVPKITRILELAGEAVVDPAPEAAAVADPVDLDPGRSGVWTIFGGQSAKVAAEFNQWDFGVLKVN
ncbi:siroheme synthase [Aspergillus nomiae NRRL 13137]|uniref:precorrin-2 dehydrogenase n=1 Tax=Aspergillus nomiae NRRL (strain ATCC 15546 / NRRL 13137 / CBS 260.88 / M93) TaxID=1509407 RepID=A0A0L1IVA2_ASPN3|nr:siroheme synthase [Aspergillus nomiae NRRL 13137]KNG83108.1 siroheme synthase [Aspergillus nomiae NRRL 13137]